MEWVDGPSVRELLAEQGRLPAEQAAAIARGVALAIEIAAHHEIVHRNIKPSSILLAPGGQPKLGNFVFARAMAEPSGDRITLEGEVVGDVEYLAPECLRDSSDIDSRADIYSLGVCLYVMITGQTPFHDPNRTRLTQRVLHDPVPPVSRFVPEIAPGLESIVLRCLAKDRADRFQSAQELVSELDQLADQAQLVEPAVRRMPAEVVAAGPVSGEAVADPAAISVDEGPVSFPSSPSSSSWRRSLLTASTEPAQRPWRTLIATIVTVVAIGSLFLFGNRWRLRRLDQHPVSQPSPEATEDRLAAP
jgi:serine/threonine-protein kinase